VGCDEGAGSPTRGTRHPPFGVAISDSGRSTVQEMASAENSASARLLVGACLIACLALLLFPAARADGAGRGWSGYLAPAGACSGEGGSASQAAKVRAIRCLVNWARSRQGVRALAPNSALQRAAAMKSRAIAECGQFSHTPCGLDASAQVRATGYRFALFGENLYAGPWGKVGPRGVVSAWLRSPAHRATLLDPGFRELGIAPVRASALLGSDESVVWTAAFGTPR
jgi:uncharacterized protein YkwD